MYLKPQEGDRRHPDPVPRDLVGGRLPPLPVRRVCWTRSPPSLLDVLLLKMLSSLLYTIKKKMT
ncbi:hypothetical protein ANANG_G00315280 [Anguilla anguilla]|uniref:Uncharacterized protein n=1 Tax=Anguilla anguilla TaxID=7936 RepID=A0A9D3LHL6_ANGAN|nr:hypothetical protein ANANG_G00315280 [Anguilla anguilla]